MSAVISGVKQKLQDYLPNQIGSNARWSDAFIEGLIVAADNMARERTESLWVTQEIDLSDGVLEYDLDSKFISVVSVEFSSDGVTYDDHLKAVTFNDMDAMSYKWRDDTGTRPEYYSLLGAPGIGETSTDAGDGTKIIIYRPVATVGSEKIRINGYGVSPGSSTNVPDDVQYDVHVNYVMSFLMVPSDIKLASEFYDRFLAGCDRAKRRFVSEFADL